MIGVSGSAGSHASDTTMDVLKHLEHASLPPRESLADRVAVILKKFILSESVAAGDRLPAERQMADTLNISRTVLREALNQLIGENILERPSPRVLRVADFDREALAASIAMTSDRDIQFRDLMELRYILEVGAMPLIIERIQLRQIDMIEELASKHRSEISAGRSGNGADVQFHTRLLQVVDNPIIHGVIPVIEEQIRSYLLREPSLLVPERRHTDTSARVIDEHQSIIEALRNRDTTAGLMAMTRHLEPYFTRLNLVADG